MTKYELVRKIKKNSDKKTASASYAKGRRGQKVKVSFPKQAVCTPNCLLSTKTCISNVQKEP